MHSTHSRASCTHSFAGERHFQHGQHCCFNPFVWVLCGLYLACYECQPQNECLPRGSME